MKEIWVKALPWKKNLVTTALEMGADAVLIPEDKIESVKELGLIKTVAKGGDIEWGRDIIEVAVQSSEDEDKIVRLAKEKRVLVKTEDWTIIPLENLIARTDNIFIEVDSIEGAKTAEGILEKGVDGILITARDPIIVRNIIKYMKLDKEEINLEELTIELIRPVGMGDRVCVDTCSLMQEGEGVLVGNSSQGLFLVHSESIENPYVAPRPFRVNAGPVHSYIRVKGGKTQYLSELKAGSEIIGVDSKGRVFPLIVGRIKIEKRPLLLIEAIGPEGTISIILQNAETIRLVNINGEPISVVKLKPGDKVLGYIETVGRHFGYKIEETITEK